MWLVFRCPKCGEPRYARDTQRTASCVKCGYRVDIERVEVVKRVFSVREAIAQVQALKAVSGQAGNSAHGDRLP